MGIRRTHSRLTPQGPNGGEWNSKLPRTLQIFKRIRMQIVTFYSIKWTAQCGICHIRDGHNKSRTRRWKNKSIRRKLLNCALTTFRVKERELEWMKCQLVAKNVFTGILGSTNCFCKVFVLCYVRGGGGVRDRDKRTMVIRLKVNEAKSMHVKLLFRS